MNPFRSVGARLSLALLAVVLGALAIVYLAVVPSVEQRLVDAKLDELATSARSLPALPPEHVRWHGYVEALAPRTNARLVVFAVDRGISVTRILPFADSQPGTGPDLRNDRIALRAAEVGEPQRGTVTRGGSRFAEFAVPASPSAVVLLSASLHDTLAGADVIERRLLVAGAIALLVALGTGYGGAWLFARRIRRLERAADRIAGGQFDEPVVDTGSDELGELAGAFDRMRRRLAHLDHARREFIANASHELRTPLFSLSGFLELLADEDLDEETRREFLETMRGQVDRLAKLAGDLLDLSRLDAGRLSVEREVVDLAAVARALADEFQPLARGTGHELEVLADGEAAALGDEQRVFQIGRALIENALVHTPAQTPVRIRTAVRDGEAVFAVEDEGPGIPDEQTAAVFDRFYRADGGAASGSGLGLAIARELGELMGGRIDLASQPGNTRFALVLPSPPR